MYKLYNNYNFIALNSWIVKLDERADKEARRAGYIEAKKGRIEGTDSNSFPPTSTPDWAIDEEWKKRTCKFYG